MSNAGNNIIGIRGSFVLQVKFPNYEIILTIVKYLTYQQLSIFVSTLLTSIDLLKINISKCLFVFKTVNQKLGDRCKLSKRDVRRLLI